MIHYYESSINMFPHPRRWDFESARVPASVVVFLK